MSKKKTEEEYTKEEREAIKAKIDIIDAKIAEEGRYRWFYMKGDKVIQISASNYPTQADKEAREWLESQKDNILGNHVIECKFVKYDTYKDILNPQLGGFEFLGTKLVIQDYPNSKNLPHKPKYSLGDLTGIDFCGVHRMAYLPNHIDKFKEAHFKKFSNVMFLNKYRSQVSKPMHYSKDIRFD